MTKENKEKELGNNKEVIHYQNLKKDDKKQQIEDYLESLQCTLFTMVRSYSFIIAHLPIIEQQRQDHIDH